MVPLPEEALPIQYTVLPSATDELCSADTLWSQQLVLNDLTQQKTLYNSSNKHQIIGNWQSSWKFGMFLSEDSLLIQSDTGDSAEHL